MTVYNKKNKIMTIVGARPQFIKASVVSRALKPRFNEILVHTGQHYDYNMSGLFFDELGIATPKYNLGISGGSHAQMVGNMLIAIEKVAVKEKPDMFLLYGDTNSTLAGALVAAKLHIPICHVEAGVRTHSMTNPEEINRICTDHISSLLLVCTESNCDELKKEGLNGKDVVVGDPMYDAFVLYSSSVRKEDVQLQCLDGESINIPEEYYYLTCHREENTNYSNLCEILKATDYFDARTIYPVHPRNKEIVLRIKKELALKNLCLLEPVGYLESVCLVKNAKSVITDSGGLQREAFFAKKKCVTILDFECWPETMIGGRNVLSRPIAEEIVRKISEPQIIDDKYQPFGGGNASKKIADAIYSFLYNC